MLPTHEFRLAPQVEIGIRTASIGAKGDPPAPLEQFLERMRRMSKIRMGPRAIDERKALRFREEIEFFGVEIVAVDD